MPKIPACDRCLLYARNPYLICAVHPMGVETETCPDFDPAPDAKPEELWQPVGASYYNGELILHRPGLGPAELLAMLDWHPLFTGRCPECEVPICNDPPPSAWSCAHCGWQGDSTSR
jgi:hypothetical protein